MYITSPFDAILNKFLTVPKSGVNTAHAESSPHHATGRWSYAGVFRAHESKIH